MHVKPLWAGIEFSLLTAIASLTYSLPAAASYGFLKLEEGWVCEGNFTGNSGNGVCVQRDTIDPGNPYQYYRGDVRNGTFSGKGTLVYENGDRYEGQMSNGRPNGKGRFIDVKNSQRYEGDFRNGEFYGRGLYVFKNGAKYQGQFAGSQPHGIGAFTFRDGPQNGIARKTYTYQGRFYLGVPNGNGTITSSDNVVCNGVFFDNEFSGNGTCTFPAGHRFADGQASQFRTYKGQLKNGQPDGRGSVLYQDGRTEQGEFREGKLLRLN